MRDVGRSPALLDDTPPAGDHVADEAPPWRLSITPLR